MTLRQNQAHFATAGVHPGRNARRRGHHRRAGRHRRADHLQRLRQAQRDTAQSVIKGTLAPAVERYRLDKEINPEGNLPGSLQDLTTSAKAGLKADQLNDPWGHPV